ncbi:MAG: hypothetical protein H6Q67_2372 [Firmicutes bacterium]|nr:hypothetical protein [Bacillota bacterium]
MKPEEITYDRKIGFVSQGEKVANDKFNQLAIVLVNGFDNQIKRWINPDGGVERAEFIDYYPDSDKLLITSTWRYYGLSRSERLMADLIFKRNMEKSCAGNEFAFKLASLNG